MKKLNRLLPLLIAAAVLAPMFFTNSCANTTQAPTGGKKDSIPPVIVGIKPLPGATGVPLSGMQIVFTFDEFVTIKNSQNIYLSPPLEKVPKSRIQGKNLVISFEDELAPETTYTLNLNDAIADNNEGNIFPGFTYVFTTGDHIDSLYITGSVQDCGTLEPVEGATVLLYKDHSDSAVFLRRPYASTKTDAWGFFSIPFIQDTLYRLYAIKDATGNNIYDPDADLVAFEDSLIRPVNTVADTIYELYKFDMKDTLECLARKTDYELKLFREKPSKQYLMNKARTGDRSAYITFNAPYVWIDSLWIGGYGQEQIISQFNILQDSLCIWVNDPRPAPDTMYLYVNYRKTDSTGILRPELELHKLFIEGVAGRRRYKSRKDIKHEDTICVFKVDAKPELFEQNGFVLEFNNPVVLAKFDSVRFRYLNPKQKEFSAPISIERDSTDFKRYIIRPDVKPQKGFEYFLDIPARAFRDVTGFYSDSLQTKVSLPTKDDLSTLNLIMKGVDRKIIVDLLSEKSNEVLRSHIIDSDRTLSFPYLKEGRYRVRITDDGNRNSIVDTGSLLERRQPEKVVYYTVGRDKFIAVPKASEIEQRVNLGKLFAK